MSALADNPPVITKFEFNPQTQEITFSATQERIKSGGNISYQITSSSAQTTFDQAKSAVATGVVGISQTWTITPGNAPVGEAHTFTITVKNSNGASASKLCLVVRGSMGQADATLQSNDYQSADSCPVPVLSSFGAVVLVLCLLVSSLIVVKRRRINARMISG